MSYKLTFTLSDDSDNELSTCIEGIPTLEDVQKPDAETFKGHIVGMCKLFAEAIKQEADNGK